MGKLPSLYSLILFDNLLSGPIPDSFGTYPELQYIQFYNNHLSGRNLDNMGNLNCTAVLELDTNMLTGTVPAAMWNFTKLYLFTVQSNNLSGSIPDTLSAASVMEFLQMNDNMFSGSIPAFLGHLTVLETVILNSNRFTGTLSNELITLQGLWTLDVSDNMLTGSVPPALGQLGELQSLDVSDNLLTGPLISCRRLTVLNTYAMQNNFFTGSLDGLFGPFVSNDMSYMYSIQLDGNQLTGTIPSQIFQLEQLKAFTAEGACFHGSIRAAICNATGLEALVLDGLQSGSRCAENNINGRHFTGPLPTRVLSFKALNTLKLAGNRLTGTFPHNITFSKYLLDLDLSRNQLTGSIPVNFQNHSWYNLDLSYNKLNGVLNPSFLVSEESLNVHFSYGGVNYNITEASSSRALSLAGNRLSGPVPSSLLPVHNISVLAGNMFECKYDKSNLPQHDQVIHTYDCASNSFNIPFYFWLTIAVCGCVVLYCLHHWHQHLQSALCLGLSEQWKLLHSWYSAGIGAWAQPELTYERLPHVRNFAPSLQAVKRCAVLCGIFELLILVPYYTAVSQYYGTHTHEYAYSVSGIYLSGAVPFALTFVLLAALMVAVIASFRLSGVGINSAIYVKSQLNFSQRTLVALVCLLVNVVVVLGANIAFVYIALYESTQLFTLAQILLSMFKSAWNLMCAPYIVRKLAHFAAPDGDDKRLMDSFFRLQLAVALFNNIAIPCLVVSGIDNNCFSNILLPPPDIGVHYIVPKCVQSTFGGGCTEFQVSNVASSTFTPPFTYGYQCSASFITYYALTFVYMALTSTVVVPTLQCAVLYLRKCVVPGTIIEQVMLAALPKIVKVRMDLAAPPPQRDPMKPIFPAELTLVNILTHMGILLTFGAIFPPIAVAMSLSICALVGLTAGKMGRYMLHAVEAHQLAYLDILNAECESVGSKEQLQQAVQIIVCFSCAFYTMFLFDTLGDAEGFRAASWVLVVVPLTASLCYIVGDAYALWQKRALVWRPNASAQPGTGGGQQPTRDSESGEGGSVEMNRWQRLCREGYRLMTKFHLLY